MEEPAFRLYTLDVSALSDGEIYGALYRAVKPERREKTDRYVFDKDKYLSLGAEYLLKCAAGDLGVDYDSEEIVREEMKKPRFKSGAFEFNLSHSGRVAVCAAGTSPIGADVEEIRGQDEKFIRRFFHPAEAEYLLSFPEGDARAEEFTRLWTLKESYVKCLGAGLSLEPPKYCILPEGGGIKLARDGDDGRFSFFEYDFRDGYRYAVCVKDLSPDYITLGKDYEKTVERITICR